LFHFLNCFIIIIISINFCKSCPYLASQINPAIPAVSGLLLLSAICTLFRTSFTDPGIIPRATPDEATDVKRQIGIFSINLIEIQVNFFSIKIFETKALAKGSETQKIVINNQQIELKYCWTCKIFRPPRTSHCSVCDNCVGN
jgi:palmitoyltransferase ZDHHC9/14/18